MANWPTSPEWYDPTLINSGKKYTDNDGVVVSDMNAIIEDLLYLKKNGTGGNGGGTSVPGGYSVTFVIDGLAYAVYAVTAGKSINAPENPTLDGLYLTGWYTSESDGDRVTFPYTPEADTVFYGHTASQIVLGFTGLSESNGNLTWTDDAAGLDTYSTEASGVYVSVTSPMDNMFPFSEIEEFEDDNGNVFVKFPKCYIKFIKNDSNVIDGFKVSNAQAEDDMFIPACFLDPSDDSNYLDYFALGKYEASGSSSKIYSKTSSTCLDSTTRANFRSAARSYGSSSNYYNGYQLEDFSMLTLYNFLCMLYYGKANIQKVYGGRTGSGSVSSWSSASITGTCDSIETLNGWNTSTDCVKMLGIENPYGNIFKWIDGIYFSSSTIYVHLLPQQFADSITNGSTLGFSRPTSSGYISALKSGTGVSTQSFVYASAVSGSLSTYAGDNCYYNGSGVVLYVGGYWASGAGAGLWYLDGSLKASSSSTNFGSHLSLM